MEVTCNRCHQTVEAENCYCPTCGLPQLVYAAEGPAGQAQPERWDEAVRDAATIDWKPALRAALLMAIPALMVFGLLSDRTRRADSVAREIGRLRGVGAVFATGGDLQVALRRTLRQ